MKIFRMIKRIAHSFAHAFDGLLYAISKERNLQLELIAAAVVLGMMIYFRVQPWEAVALIFAIFGVLIMEMLNTLVERLINVFRPRLHPIARVIKDMTAAAVLMSAICALAVGIIIFWPYLIG